MVKYIATLLGIALAVMFVINRIERNAANNRELQLQREHNEQVLAITAEQRHEDSIHYARIDSLKGVLRVKATKLARANARADSLKGVLDSQVVDLPELIPACNPWAEALTTCQKVVAQKDSIVKGLTFAFDSATAYSDSLGILYHRERDRGDSLAQNLRLTEEAIDKSECRIIFGVPCPSRTVSAIGASVLTLILVEAVK